MGRITFLIVPFFFIAIHHLYSQRSYVDEKTGIEIEFDVSPKMFPKHWYTKEINARAVSLSIREYERVTKILNRAMSKYPEHVLKENLTKIYAFNNLNFYGLSYGGTFSVSGKAVYITDDTVINEKDPFIESFFHHEFSSILLRKHPCYVSKKAWKSNNPHAFHYGKGGREAIRSGNSSMVFDSVLNQEGFLNKYSQSSLEEDMNVFSQNLFSGGEAFWTIVDRYDKIKAKTMLIIGFFHKIDPVFTEEFFRKLLSSPLRHSDPEQ